MVLPCPLNVLPVAVPAIVKLLAILILVPPEDGCRTTEVPPIGAKEKLYKVGAIVYPDEEVVLLSPI